MLHEFLEKLESEISNGMFCSVDPWFEYIMYVIYNFSFSVAAGIGTFFSQSFTQKISINASIKSEPELSYQKLLFCFEQISDIENTDGHLGLIPRN